MIAPVYLDGEQERRVEGGVLHRQAHHHDREQQGGVHRLADDEDAERGDHHDRGERPERDAHQCAASDRSDSAVPARRAANSAAKAGLA